MRQNKQGKLPSEWALDLLLLLLILGGFLWSLRQAYGLELAGKPFFLRVGLPAVALPWLLVRLPRRRWWIFGATVLLVLAGWHWHEAWLTGGCQLLQQALTALEVPVEVESQWLAGSQRYALWTATYFALLTSMLVGMTVLVLRSAVLTWVLTLPWLAPAVILGHDISWMGLLTLTLGGCLLLLTGRSYRFDRGGSVRQAWMALPLLLVALGLVTALLPRQDYARPPWANELRNDLEAVGGSLNNGVLGNLGGFLPGGDQVSVSLSNAGPRNFKDNVVLEVESDYHGTVYLRGTAAAVYTGEEWADLPESVYEQGLGDDGLPNLVQGYSPLNFPAMANSSNPYYEMTITYPKSLSGWMYTPYQLLTSPDEIADVTFVNDTHLERDFGIRTKNLFFIPPGEAQVLSRSTQWEAAVAEAEYRQFVYENYLEVPDGFGETFDRFMRAYSEFLMSVNDLEIDTGGVIIWENGRVFSAHSISGEEPLAVMNAKVIANFLAVMTEYDLNTPLTPEGKDFVDYFLNESHRGYCVHYASAGVLMLRLSGIPARYVTGYLVKIPSSGRAEVLDSDAHAWVEVYVDGYGWYPVEMTPPAEIGLSQGEGIGETMPEQPEPEEETPREEEETPEQPEQKPQEERPETPEQPEETPDTPEESQENGAGISSWVPWTLAGILILSLFPLHSRYKARRRDRQFSDPDHSRAVLAMYRHLEQLQPWGTDPNVLRQLAQKAQYSSRGLNQTEWQAAVALWQQEREKLDQLSKVRRFWLHWIRGVI